MLVIALIIGILIAIYLILRIYRIVYVKFRNNKIKIKSYNDLDTLNRDINVDYSPAVLSYLFNQKIEIKKDITASLINLYNKGVIEIKKNNNKYEVLPTNIERESELKEDEKYLYYCFVKKQEQFSITKWEELIKYEYNEYKFSKPKGTVSDGDILPFDKKDKIACLIVALICALFIYIFSPNDYQFVLKAAMFLGMFFVCMVLYYAHYIFIDYSTYTNVRLNHNGKKEINKWLKFKKFIKEYTLLKERKIEEINLFEKYIPYAMVLNVNKEYNKEVEGISRIVAELMEISQQIKTIEKDINTIKK